MRGNYSVKSDAFSFGVMVLEIVTGRKNSDDNSRQCDDLLTMVLIRLLLFFYFELESNAVESVCAYGVHSLYLKF